MNKARLEAFSDGVIAIIITIMVLEMKAPHGAEFSDLIDLAPVFISYVISFVYIGIYWNNHHHLIHSVQKVNGRVLWANMHLLFWLSLVPFVTAWMGVNHFAKLPMAVYGFILFVSGFAYYILSKTLIAQQCMDSKPSKIKDYKSIFSLVAYLVAIPISFFQPWVAFSIYVIVAGFWVIPDRRHEKQNLEKSGELNN